MQLLLSTCKTKGGLLLMQVAAAGEEALGDKDVRARHVLGSAAAGRSCRLNLTDGARMSEQKMDKKVGFVHSPGFEQRID
jgi:hypothetical protein